MAACSPEQQWYQRRGRRTCRPNWTSGTSSGVCMSPRSSSERIDCAAATCAAAPLWLATAMALCSDVKTGPRTAASGLAMSGFIIERP